MEKRKAARTHFKFQIYVYVKRTKETQEERKEEVLQDICISKNEEKEGKGKRWWA